MKTKIITYIDSSLIDDQTDKIPQTHRIVAVGFVVKDRKFYPHSKDECPIHGYSTEADEKFWANPNGSECDCPKTTPQAKNWDEMFDEQFSEIYCDSYSEPGILSKDYQLDKSGYPVDIKSLEDIKDFIHNLLLDQRGELLEKINKLQKACSKADGTIDGVTALHELLEEL